MEYNFYGADNADVKATGDEYKGIQTPYDLYDALTEIWCADTCAPRMLDSAERRQTNTNKKGTSSILKRL